MSIGSHQSPRMESDTWLTPPEILAKFRSFDLDPCTPPVMPWVTAANRIAPPEDGLAHPWFGRVWLNPPYSREVGKWLAKLADHGNGIALIFARTETSWFFEHIWRRATGLLFIEGRLHFHRPDGSRAKANGGAPSVLVAYGLECADELARCSIAGQYVPLGGS